MGKQCKEIIVVTDGQGTVSPGAIANAIANRVKINAVVVGGEAILLRGAAIATRGTYLTGTENDLGAFFTNDFFNLFNNNFKWLVFWLGMAWIALMWTLVLPIDSLDLTGMAKYDYGSIGKISS